MILYTKRAQNPKQQFLRKGLSVLAFSWKEVEKFLPKRRMGIIQYNIFSQLKFAPRSKAIRFHPIMVE